MGEKDRSAEHALGPCERERRTRSAASVCEKSTNLIVATQESGSSQMKDAMAQSGSTNAYMLAYQPGAMKYRAPFASPYPLAAKAYPVDT